MRKFTGVFDVTDWEIETPEGWKSINKVMETIPYKKFRIECHDKLFIECADDHILIDEYGNEIFAQNLIVGDIIKTVNDLSIVVNVVDCGIEETMYDVEVDSKSHLYYSNGIVSHNTTTVAAFMLHEACFKKNQRLALLANKGDTAREILSRVKMMFEYLPWFLKPGVVEWNKGSIELSNGTKIISAATSSSSIRGQSMHCVSGDTFVTIEDDDGKIYHTHIDMIKASSPNYKYIHQDHLKGNDMYFTVYKITNIVNNKIYIGYHQTKNLDDGYMGSGKLIKLAIEKYGIASFKKEYIDIFDNKEDAESLEAMLVDEEFTLRDDTYNICLGGNVRIMCGVNNPFYGKTHSAETRLLIGKSSVGRFLGTGTEVIYNDILYPSIQKICLKNNWKLSELNKKIKDGVVKFADKQKSAEFFDDVEQTKVRIIYNRHQKSIMCKKLFTGVPKSEEHRKKIGDSNKKVPHTWQDKINKNPDKIRKTAEKHRGMKRTSDTCKNISESRKKMCKENGSECCGLGMKYIHNTETQEVKRVSADFMFDLPWAAGSGKTHNKGTKYIFNTETNEVKRVKQDYNIVYPWIVGRKNK